MFQTYRAADDIDVLTTSFPLPGLGVVPINAFVLRGPDPVLVDTGPGVLRDEFMTALSSVIDVGELKWLWLTHPDPDHTGAIATILAENSAIRVATTYLTAGMLSLVSPLDMERVYLINPGQELVIGDRTLVAMRPPAFDNPATLGFFERTSAAFFSADCFGALLAEAPHDAAELSEEELHRGQVTWATIDSPWLHRVDQRSWARALDGVRVLEPALILSSHLPAASGKLAPRILRSLAHVPDAEPFVGPDQAALERMMAEAPPSPPEGPRQTLH